MDLMLLYRATRNLRRLLEPYIRTPLLANFRDYDRSTPNSRSLRNSIRAGECSPIDYDPQKFPGTYFGSCEDAY